MDVRPRRRFLQMKPILTLWSLLALFSILLAACGNSDVPPLAVTDRPTLVFIYTEA